MVELIILRKNGLAAKLSGSSAVAFCYTMGQGRKGDAFSRCSFRYMKKKKKKETTRRRLVDFLFFFERKMTRNEKRFILYSMKILMEKEYSNM